MWATHYFSSSQLSIIASLLGPLSVREVARVKVTRLNSPLCPLCIIPRLMGWASMHRRLVRGAVASTLATHHVTQCLRLGSVQESWVLLRQTLIFPVFLLQSWRKQFCRLCATLSTSVAFLPHSFLFFQSSEILCMFIIHSCLLWRAHCDIALLQHCR